MMLSKSAPIEDICIKKNHNLQEAETPNMTITVDEQLFPYRGRTSLGSTFRQNRQSTE